MELHKKYQNVHVNDESVILYAGESEGLNLFQNKKAARIPGLLCLQEIA